jgi:hypothetical protein
MSTENPTPPPLPQGAGQFTWELGQSDWQEVAPPAAVDLPATDQPAPQPSPPEDSTDALPRSNFTAGP